MKRRPLPEKYPQEGPPPAWIGAQFARIAPDYDRLNHLLSLGLESGWREAALSWVNPPAQARVLDVCAGTGELARRWLRRHPDSRVTLVDFCPEMLGLARGKLAGRNAELVAADALRLPFEDGSFEVVLSGFGLRNLQDWRQGLAEMRRVLRPGGELALLEMCGEPLPWPMRWYIRQVVPRVGRELSGDPGAYAWLAASVEGFARAEEVAGALREVGFAAVRVRSFFGGVCSGFWGRAPGQDER